MCKKSNLNLHQLYIEYIMRNTFILFCLIWLVGCTNQPKAPTDSALPVLDLTKDYPKMELDINDIAEAEYIPLETTDESVIALGAFLNISDKYIIMADPLGPVFIFDRKGKFIRAINNYGQGPEEHNVIIGLTVDFQKEEYYISQHAQIKVYDFSGKWQRSLKVPEGVSYTEFFNYNEEKLIGNNSFYDRYNPYNLPMDTTPYHLIDKQTGDRHPLPITIKSWVSKTLDRRKVMLDKNTARMETKSLSLLPRIWANGYDFFISEFSKDTLYRYKNDQLTPFAIRYPSIDSYEIPTVISPVFYTDNYFFFKPVEMKLVENDTFEPYTKAPLLMWDRRNNEIRHIARIYDSNRPSVGLWTNMHYERSEIPNYIFKQIPASQLCEEYEAGKLKGKLKEVASRLKEDDNYVIAIYKLNTI